MITVKNITKTFDSKKVLDNISTSIPSSGIFAVSGASGSGKTTFMRILAGLETPDSGTVEGLEGKKISVMFQDDRLLPWYSATDNVAAVCTKEKAKEWLEKVELSHAADKKPSELSGGMCRRVALARAMAFEGDILFLDEPFKGLDIELRERMAELIKDFAKTKPVILITHDRWEASLAQDELKI